jgi:hypothetical protein
MNNKEMVIVKQIAFFFVVAVALGLVYG